MFIQSVNHFPRGVPEDALAGASPRIFWGTVAPDGDATPWVEAVLGSLYIRKAAGNVVLYLKDEANSADADWAAVTVS